MDVRKCFKCGSSTNTFRHPNARIWCNNEGCRYVNRDEGYSSYNYPDGFIEGVVVEILDSSLPKSMAPMPLDLIAKRIVEELKGAF
jgi:hypothetical protein